MTMWECHSYMSVLQEYLISVLHDSYQICFSRTTWVVCSGHESNVRIADVFDPQLVGFAASSPVPHLLVTLTDVRVIGPSAAFMPQFAIKRAPKLSKMNSSRLQGWNGICADLICLLDSMASLNQGSFVLEDHNSKFGRNLGEVNIKSAWKRGCRSLWSFTLQKDSWAFSKVLLLPWRSRAPLTMAVQFQFKSGRALGFGCSLHGGLALQVIPGVYSATCQFNTVHFRCVIWNLKHWYSEFQWNFQNPPLSH